MRTSAPAFTEPEKYSGRLPWANSAVSVEIA